jgi:radical SAM superfamily enzyme YgiQ (UPF0313 family)
MKALLVNPPSIHMITTNVPEVVDDETGFYPPLGLLSVAAHAREHSGWEIAVVDAEVERLTHDALRERIGRERPDLVGIQCLTFTLIDAAAAARAVKEIDPSIHVCLGGPHVNIYPDESIALAEVDSLVLGEGEIPFSAFLRSFGKTEELSKIPGLVLKKGEEIVKTPPPCLIDDLDALPFPARDLVPWREYYSVLAAERPVTTMMTSRGCPYKCVFCDRPHLGKVFRYRSATSVVDEMEECVRMGIREIVFYDDTFSINRQRVVDVCDEIGQRGVKISWDIRARVNTVDREILRRLREAGCRRIHFGVESGNASVLRSMKKGITLEQARNAFAWSRKEGIATLAYFMVGSPGEGEREIRDTIAFAREIDPDFVHFSVATPFPATELYRKALEEGVVSRDVWQEFAASPREDFVPPLWSETFTEEELVAFLHRAYKRFYSRPTYLVRQIFRVRSLGELRRKARAGIRVLGMRKSQ